MITFNSWFFHFLFVYVIVYSLINFYLLISKVNFFLFIINYSIVWSLSFFLPFLYIFFMFSTLLIFLSSVKDILLSSKFKKNTQFDYLTGFDFYWIFISILVLYFILNFAWSGPSTSAWFGNLIFSKFQYKINFLVIFIFYLIISVYSTTFYFSSKELFDYIAVCFNFFFWISSLFFSNSIFTFIFFIEILSSIIFLMLVTSTFSTTYFYNNLNFNLHTYFQPSMPFFFVQMLIFFFWMSLIASLNLFLFIILFYIKFLTFDWFLFEFIFFYSTILSDFKDIFLIIFIWFNLLFSIFLKCGLVPFYFWKPFFFKGMPVHALFFYIIFFYFFLFLFIIYFFLIYINEIFFYFIGASIFVLILGTFFLLTILCESFYIKSFLALSSILNTLFILLTLNSVNIVDFFLFL